MQETESILIKYFTDKIEPLKYIGGKSDWIDLRCAEETVLKKGEMKLIHVAAPIMDVFEVTGFSEILTIE